MSSLVNKLKPWILPTALPVALFACLTWMYLAPSGQKTIVWEAGETSVLIGRPLPDARTSSCEDNHGSCITALDEPLYMSITPPAGLWHEMRVVVEYDLHDQEKFELGLMQDFATQSFVLLPIKVYPIEGGIHNEASRTGESVFSLDGVQKENGAYKLILSLPGVEDVVEKPGIHTFEVTFIRHTSVMGEIKWFIKGLWKRRV
jgi:hypothetical protein